MSLSGVVKQSRKIRNDIDNFLKICKILQSDKQFIKNKIKTVCSHIKIIKYLLNNKAKPGAEKSSCFYTLSHLYNVRDTLNSYLSVEGGNLNPYVKWIDFEEAFDGNIQVGIIKNVGHIEIDNFLKDSQEVFKNKILTFQNSIKVYTVFTGIFYVEKLDKILEERKDFITKTFTIYKTSNIDDLFEKNIYYFLKKEIEEFELRDSGWSLRSIEFLKVHIHTLDDLSCAGKSFIALPKCIQNKKACINVYNDDEQCFKWSILSALTLTYIQEKKDQGVLIDEIHNTNRCSSYIKYEEKFNLDFTNIKFPVSPDQIHIFEKNNKISINVYNLEFKNNNYSVKLFRPTKQMLEKHINLLLLNDYTREYEDDDNEGFDFSLENFEQTTITKKRKLDLIKKEPNYHYVWIKDISKLLGRQVSNHHGKKYFCDRCFHYLHTKTKFTEHVKKCFKMNQGEIILPDENNEEKNTISFKNFNNKQKMNFVIYADFESLLEACDNEEQRKCQVHEPLSVGYYFKCRYDDSLSRYVSYDITKENNVSPAEWFVNELKERAEEVKKIYNDKKDMIDLTLEEKIKYENSNICHICEDKNKPFIEKDLLWRKVQDHSHITGS